MPTPVKSKRKSTIKIKPFRNIDLLNMLGKGSGAYISCSIDEKIGKWNGYNIIISDCGSKTELHGSLQTIENRTNAYYKIDTLIKSLTEMKDHLSIEFKNKGLKVK